MALVPARLKDSFRIKFYQWPGVGTCLAEQDYVDMTFAFAQRPAVLVVEDEPLVRMIAAEVIEEAGFTAFEASNAAQAVALLKENNDIRILFTDVNMPGAIDGVGLAHIVAERWPVVKIIVTTGRGGIHAQDLPSGGVFLGKPYNLRDLVSSLHKLVAEKARSLN
jgi:two-component system, response regulator PdtaR